MMTSTILAAVAAVVLAIGWVACSEQQRREAAHRALQEEAMRRLLPRRPLDPVMVETLAAAVIALAPLAAGMGLIRRNK